MKPWIGVDLDGTLAHYDDWQGPEHIGAPIAPMVARVKRWIAEGRDVRIFTARVHRDDGANRQHIEAWCAEHLGCVLPVTNEKDWDMIEVWDDRAVQIITNTGRRADGNTSERERNDDLEF